MTRPGPVRITAVITLAALLLAPMFGCDRSDEPEVSERPVRICSVNLSADEMLADLVDTSRVVGVTVYCDDPGVSNVVDVYPENVMRIAGAELETLLQLAPDLVILSPYHTEDFKELMRRSALPRHDVAEIRSSADVLREYLRLGEVVGSREKALAITADLEQRAEALAAIVAGTTSRPRILYVGSQFTAGRDCLIGEIIERAGARNVGAEMGIEGLARFEPESALAADPRWLLVSGWEQDQSGELGLLAALPAASEGRIIVLPGRLINATTRHWIEAAETLARRIHPTAFDGEPR